MSWEYGDDVEEPSASCAENPPLLEPLGGCGMFEADVHGVCVAASGGSASVRFGTSLACVGEAVCRERPDSQVLFRERDPAETSAHHIVLRNLPQDVSMACDVLCHCRDGGSAQLLGGGAALFIPADLGVRVTEVFIDPKGREPDQEFVEIVNTSGFPLDIGGWRLADSPPPRCEGADGCAVDLNGYGDPIPEGTILPHMAPVILVAEGYDESDPADTRPPQGCQIVRLDASLGERGLRNSGGEPVFLIDPAGGMATFYPNALGTTPAGVSAERLSLDWPDGDVLNWAENPGGASSPCVWAGL